mmetsp:Transcript_12999/g.35397  ORF Transcript_12999/g.35397 Transcript_12999/m.35397 type:complete len:102 (+) Transcript_12999:82-387(+)
MSDLQGSSGAVGAGRTTAAPDVLNSDPDKILGVPVWVFAAVVGLLCMLLMMTPLCIWLRRMANLSKNYVPSEQPDVDGFVREVVLKAEACGTLNVSRIGRT